MRSFASVAFSAVAVMTLVVGVNAGVAVGNRRVVGRDVNNVDCSTTTSLPYGGPATSTGSAEVPWTSVSSSTFDLPVPVPVTTSLDLPVATSSSTEWIPVPSSTTTDTIVVPPASSVPYPSELPTSATTSFTSSAGAIGGTGSSTSLPTIPTSTAGAAVHHPAAAVMAAVGLAAAILA